MITHEIYVYFGLKINGNNWCIVPDQNYKILQSTNYM